MKLTKKLISVVLAATMVMSLSVPAWAEELATDFNMDESMIAEDAINVAYVESLDDTGSNIGTDQVNAQYILSASAYNIAFSLDASELEVNGNINGVSFSASGSVVTTNQNRNLLLYDTNDSCGNYEIAYMAVERELNETALFFEDFHKNNLQYVNVVKLYMQPMDTNSLILIEIFLTSDFVASFLENQSIEYNSTEANKIQSWFVRYYDPVEKEADLQPLQNTAYKTLDLSETYNHMGAQVTFRFVVRLYYTAPDLAKGSSAVGNFYFKVAESCTTSDLASFNSSTQSHLQLQDLNIKLSTMPYVICTSQEPYRKSIRNSAGTIKTSFSVSFGFAYGLISATGNLNFNKSEIMDTAAVPLSYEDDKGAKGTECGVLPSNLYLNDEGGYYGFKVDYMDTSSTARTGVMSVQFDYTVNNLYDYTDSYSDTYSASFVIYVR